MKRTLALLIVLISLISCGEKTSEAETANSPDSTILPVSTTSSVTPTITEAGTSTPDYDASRRGKDGQVVPQNDSIVRFMVSFISKGFGIDTKSKSTFDQWLMDRKDIQYAASPWGREGEWSYCFPLKNKTAAEQEQFIRDVKNLLPNRDLIVFSENIPCEKRR